MGYRISDIKYDVPVLYNPSLTDPSNAILNSRSFSTESFRIGYQAGVSIDLVIHKNPETGQGTIFFIKGGTTGPLWKDKYEIHDVKYDPHIRQADWLIHVGFKFFGPR